MGKKIQRKTKDKKKEMISVKFDKEFYTPKAVEKAIVDYADFATFEIIKSKDRIEVRISNIDKDFEEIFEDEFCNYVLGEGLSARN